MKRLRATALLVLLAMSPAALCAQEIADQKTPPQPPVSSAPPASSEDLNKMSRQLDKMAETIRRTERNAAVANEKLRVIQIQQREIAEAQRQEAERQQKAEVAKSAEAARLAAETAKKQRVYLLLMLTGAGLLLVGVIVWRTRKGQHTMEAASPVAPVIQPPTPPALAIDANAPEEEVIAHAKATGLTSFPYTVDLTKGKTRGTITGTAELNSQGRWVYTFGKRRAFRANRFEAAANAILDLRESGSPFSAPTNTDTDRPDPATIN